MKRTKLATILLCSLIINGTALAGSNTGLFANYNFNNCDATDNSVNKNNGIIYGTECRTELGNSALHFANNSNSGWFDQKDWIVLPNYTGDKISFQARIKWELANNYDPTAAIWSVGDGSGSNFVSLWVNSNTGKLWISGQKKNPIDISNGAWFTVAVVASTTKTTLYVNGKLIETVINTAPINFQDAPQYLSFHQWYDGGAGSSRFAGLIDDVKIYSRNISSSEVRQLYNATQPVSGIVKGLQSYSLTCTNTVTKEVKTLSIANSLDVWDCQKAGLTVKPNQKIEIKLLGNTYQ